MKARGVRVGGGSSLSVVNDRDLSDPKFDRVWLSADWNGNPVERDGKKFGTLSAPGFRKYLIGKAVEQARLGVTELHFGETNGELAFDDWTLGVKGRGGFPRWARRAHRDQPSGWWTARYGALGDAMRANAPVTRALYAAMSGDQRAAFMKEWGTPGSWHGTGEDGKPAFLAWQYRHNLEAFLAELKEALPYGVRVDAFGMADWMARLRQAPDAFLSAPPDERWGFRWNTDPGYPLEENEERILRVMRAEVAAAKPATVVYMFDHPKPFLESFTLLSDERQAAVTRFFAAAAAKAGARFAYRGYAEVPGGLGPKVREVVRGLCVPAR